MNETKLEQLAISELLREAETQNDSNTQEPVEDKKNKLIKTNKKFLNRTLNSVMSHNKREHERTQKNCREKLQALEDRRRKRLRKESEDRKYGKHSASSNETLSDSSASESELIIPMPVNAASSQMGRKRPKHTDKNTKKTTTTPTTTKPKRSTKPRTKSTTATTTTTERAKSPATQYEEIEYQRLQYEREENYAKHFDQLAAYALASESYHQVGKWLCYQALLAGSYESYESFEPKVYDTYESLGLSGIEVLDPLESLDTFSENNIISLSSDDEVKEELDLDAYLEEGETNFETIQIENNCISLDSDTDEELSESKELPAVEIECELNDDDDSTVLKQFNHHNDDDEDENNDEEEENNDDGAVIQTIELTDSSDGEEDTKPTEIITNGSIDLTSD